MVEQNEVGAFFLLTVPLYLDAVLEMNVWSDDTVGDVSDGKMPPFTPFCILFLLFHKTSNIPYLTILYNILW